MGNRPDKTDVIRDADARRVSLQAGAFAGAIVAGAVTAIVTGYHHREICVLAARPKLGRGIEQDLRPLERLEPAGEECHPGVFEAKAAAQCGPVVLGEEAWIDSGLGDADAVAGRAIQPDEVLCLGRARSHQPVCLCSELAFRLCPEAHPVAVRRALW